MDTKNLPNKSDKRALMILSMHRSGSSAMARVCNLLGAELGDELIPANSGNSKGYWENKEILDVNNKILNKLGKEWFDLGEIPEKWWLKKKFRSLYIEAAAIFESNFEEHTVICMKDPRFCLLMPMWKAILTDFGWKIFCIVLFRNPMEVSSSLNTRDGLSIPRGIALWLEYTLAAERNTRQENRIIIRYDDLITSPDKVVKSIDSYAGLDWQSKYSKVEEEIFQNVESSLKHHSFDDEIHGCGKSLESPVNRLLEIFNEARFTDGNRRLKASCDDASSLVKFAHEYYSGTEVSGLEIAQIAEERKEKLEKQASDYGEKVSKLKDEVQKYLELSQDRKIKLEKSAMENRERISQLKDEVQKYLELSKERKKLLENLSAENRERVAELKSDIKKHSTLLNEKSVLHENLSRESGLRISELKQEVQKYSDLSRERKKEIKVMAEKNSVMSESLRILKAENAELRKCVNKESSRADRLLLDLHIRTEELLRLEKIKNDYQLLLVTHQKSLKKKTDQYENMKSSISWRLTSPFRKAVRMLK